MMVENFSSNGMEVLIVPPQHTHILVNDRYITMSYHVDDFKGHSTKLLGIITNEDPQNVNRLDTEQS